VKTKRNIADQLSRRFLLIVREEDTFAEKFTVPFTSARFIVLVFAFLLFSFGISLIVVNTFFVYGGKNIERDQYLALLTQVDELQQELNNQEKYLANFKKSMAGEIIVDSADLKKPTHKIEPDEKKLLYRHPTETQLRQEFEGGESDLTSLNETEDIQSLLLFQPLDGVVSRGFKAKEKHYGVDIVAKKNEPIKSIADGTVIFASWTQDSGYVIGIQHKNQLVSYYKHNAILHKEVGDIVKAGDIIAVIGNSGEYTDGPHLHFELWYNGTPIDPANFISF